MLFSSAIFLFLFLPIVLLVHYISPARWRNVILLIASLFFYTWGETYLVVVMLTTIVIDFIAAQVIENGRRKLGLLVSILSNLTLLGFFKYFNFGVQNFVSVMNTLGVSKESLPAFPIITLPLGISFYTFQSLSYTIDVYRGHTKANRNIINFTAFVTLFPQLIAGPIVRYVDVERQFLVKNISVENFSLGIKRFVIGLARKMLLANPCATLADSIFGTPIDELSSLWAWIGIVAYAFQIYFDFSGYSDMAIGLGKMFGFDFLENFNFPYISKSLREFWQRWHISLSSWFRDYLYIPLGGSRVKPIMVYRNLIIVFFLTGLWHGASWNFVVWGLFHGLFLIIERMGFSKIMERVWVPLRHVYTIVVVLVGWVFFRAETLGYSLGYIFKMFAFEAGDLSRISYLEYYFFNRQYLVILVVVFFFSTQAPMLLMEKFSYSTRLSVTSKVMEWAILFGLFILSCAFIAGGSYNPFIYFRF